MAQDDHRRTKRRRHAHGLVVRAKQCIPTMMRKGLASIALLMSWMIWKMRNECIFDGAQPLVHVLVSKIKDEAEQWARAGARGLSVILPTTWDVH
uniref:Uncharacterized protein n=1 Tax=Hordeum vulgare subsp. vulgare TaxID=112509 RepID=A0A8I6WPU5_HORVV